MTSPSQTRWQVANYAAGNCRRCRQPRVNADFCEKHRVEAALKTAARTSKRRASGRCIKCSAPRARSGTFCEACILWLRKYQADNHPRQKKRPYLCSLCGKDGHGRHVCPNRWPVSGGTGACGR